MTGIRGRLATVRTQESGQIMVLTLGLALVVLALVFVVASVSAVQIERKQLLAMADAAALDAATRIDTATYYGSGRVEVSDATVRSAVGDYLAAHRSALGLERAGMAEPTGSPDGRSARVTLVSVADLPLLPWFLEDAGGVRLRVTTTARAG